MPAAFYDTLETRDPAVRRRAEGRRLARQIAHAKTNSPYFAKLLAKVDAAAVTSRTALAALPLTRKADIKRQQEKKRPFGGLPAVATDRLSHIYQSPGPMYEIDGRGADPWRFGRALWAAGIRPGRIVHNTFSYHLTPLGMMMDKAAQALGCPVFPAGGGNTEQQLQAIADLKPDAFLGTPSFLKILLTKARGAGVKTTSLKHASVGAEPFPPSLRKELKALGVTALQMYGTAELGLVSYESPAMDGMIVDEGVLVEIVRPGTGEPVADGDVGEVVVTSFNPTYPLIRYATGDLSAVLAGPSPCGRTNMRLKGWMGRTDQATKVKGMFVHPAQITQVAGRHPEVLKARLVVENPDNLDRMTLLCESQDQGAALAAAIAATLQAVCKLRGAVTLVLPGSLPDDGKVIVDQRKLD